MDRVAALDRKRRRDSMVRMTRRDLSLLLPALGFFGAGMAEAQAADTQHSRVFVFDDLVPKQSATGATTRAVMRGKLPTGETVEMHETTLPPGASPHPPHHHVHCEFMLIREGTVEFTFNGKPERIGPGGIAYAASGEEHGLKNVGSVPANYFVIAIGIEPAAS